MHNKLLIEAFEKAKFDTGSDRITHLSKHLSDFITEDSNEPYGERILRDNYNKISKNPKEKINLKGYASEALSHYLDYEDYNDYVNANRDSVIKKRKKAISFFTRNKITIGIVLALIIGFLIYNSVTRQRWMVWQENHYIEVDFDVKTYDINQLKVYKQERIDHFKKITPKCDFNFFNKDGSVRLWYGKNNKKELEYFTALGLHPETGKTLKPITQYMKDKYICNKVKYNEN
jgi:hypothetical protein